MIKKLTLILLAAFMLLITPNLTHTFARAHDDEAPDSQEEIEIEDSSSDDDQSSDTDSDSGSMNQNRNQNNEDGDDSGQEIEVERDRENDDDSSDSANDDLDDSIDVELDSTDDSSDRGGNSTPQERVQTVNREIRNLVEVRLDDDSLQTRLERHIRDQERIQTDIDGQLTRIESRNKIVRWLMGPDYSNIEALKTKLEENQQQIAQLLELRGQVSSEEDQAKLQTVINALDEQNMSLQERIGQEEGQFSLLGWIFKWINRR